MSTNKERLLKIIQEVGKRKKKFRVSDILNTYSEEISRQYVSSILKDLVKKEKLIREGGGRFTVYVLPQFSRYLSNNYRKRVKNLDLKEHEVLEEIMEQTPLLNNVRENVRSIFTYAFLEMLNNAIEHSKSKFIDIDIHRDKGVLSFGVRDYGIGVFRSVMQKRKLTAEIEAIQDLLKGKVTTQPRAHSGEGIFFTSRVSEVFDLESYGHRLRIDNTIPDVFIEEPSKSKKGTLVSFSMSANTRGHLNDVFKKYQTNPKDYAFDKTEVHIRLYTIGGIYISRSQARRVLTDLHQFKSVIMDFNKVPTIGQAFADEVFRVFAQKYPNVAIKPINMNESVKFMVDRVERAQPPLLG